MEEWEKHFETIVMDADGFPSGTKRKETLFTERDFLSNVRTSTVRFSDKLLKAINNLNE